MTMDTGRKCRYNGRIMRGQGVRCETGASKHGEGISAEPGEWILRRHPQGRKGVGISRQECDAMSAAILGSLRGRRGVPLQVVRQEVEGDLQGKFEGSISWYFTTVKLDLEARGIVDRVPGKRPQHIRLRAVPSDGWKG